MLGVADPSYLHSQREPTYPGWHSQVKSFPSNPGLHSPLLSQGLGVQMSVIAEMNCNTLLRIA